MVPPSLVVMRISWSEESGSDGVDSLVRQLISETNPRPLHPDLHLAFEVRATAADCLQHADEWCRRAFANLDGDALRAGADGGVTGSRPVTVEQLRALEQAVTAAAEVGSVSQAAQAMAMARYAAVDQEKVDDDTGFAAPVEHSLGHEAEFADVDLGVACGWSPRTASNRLSGALSACTRTPRLLALAVEGQVPYWKVSAVAAEVAAASPATAARVEQHLLDARGFDAWGLVKLRNTARALVSQWEADAARETRKRKARDLTGVWAGPCDEAGLAELRAVGPTDQIAKIMGAVEALAQQWLKQPQHPDDHPADAAAESSRPVKPSPGQLRLKALHDLVCEGTNVSFQVTVQFPIVPDDDAGGAADRPPPRGAAFTAEADDGSPPSGCSPPAGCSSAPPPDPSRHPDDEDRRDDQRPTEPRYRAGWARVPGVGLIDPAVVAALNDAVGVELARALVDVRTGATVETRNLGYVPGERLRRFVQQRDGTCRLPGCSRPAARCEQDHVVEWPIGATEGGNLASLCKHHHDAKTARHWDYELSRDGVCTWTSPTGRTYVTHPDSAWDDQAIG